METPARSETSTVAQSTTEPTGPVIGEKHPPTGAEGSPQDVGSKEVAGQDVVAKGTDALAAGEEVEYLTTAKMSIIMVGLSMVSTRETILYQ